MSGAARKRRKRIPTGRRRGSTRTRTRIDKDEDDKDIDKDEGVQNLLYKFLSTRIPIRKRQGYRQGRRSPENVAPKKSTSTRETTTTNPYFPKRTPLRSYRDQSYALAADFGTPPQRLYLSIDVFDTETKVADSSCKECCHRRRYDRSKSSTSRCKFWYRPGWSPDTEYLECNDTLQIATLVSRDEAPFTDAVLGPGELKASAFARVPSDGTAGLGDMDIWYQGWTSDFIWSLYLKTTCTSDTEDNAGTLWVEQLDSEHCGEVASVVPIDYRAETAYAGLATLLSVYAPTSTDPSRGLEGRWTAAFSTTSPYIVIPETTFKYFNRISWSATEDKDTGEWVVDCAYDAREELQFTFEGNSSASLGMKNAFFTFKVRHFIDKVGSQCVLRIRPKRQDELNRDYWTFGLPFFRKYCALFDVGLGPTNSISFAEQKGYKVPNCTYDAVKTLAPCVPTTSTTTTTIPTLTTSKAASVTFASASLISLVASVVSLSR